MPLSFISIRKEQHFRCFFCGKNGDVIWFGDSYVSDDMPSVIVMHDLGL